MKKLMIIIAVLASVLFFLNGCNGGEIKISKEMKERIEKEKWRPAGEMPKYKGRFATDDFKLITRSDTSIFVIFNNDDNSLPLKVKDKKTFFFRSPRNCSFRVLDYIFIPTKPKGKKFRYEIFRVKKWSEFQGEIGLNEGIVIGPDFCFYSKNDLLLLYWKGYTEAKPLKYNLPKKNPLIIVKKEKEYTFTTSPDGNCIVTTY